MYKYFGLGLLGLLAVMLMPTNDVTTSPDPSLYGLATLSVLDNQGNVILTNTVHNIVVNTGTQQMLGAVFQENLNVVGSTEITSANAICLTDETGFTAVNSINSTSYATLNNLDGVPGDGDSCIEVTYTLTPITINSGVVNFAAGNTNVADGEVITGFVICNIADGSGTADACVTSEPVISAIATSVTLGTGETVDITYAMTLD